MKRVLIVNVNWIGDVLFSTPAIRAVRRHVPDAHIACLAAPRTEALLKHNPHLNELITLEDRLPLGRLPAMLSAVARLRKERFDTAIFFSRSDTRASIAALSGIGQRHGFRPPYGNRFLTHAHRAPETPIHKTDEFLYLLEQMGIKPAGRVPEFVPAPGAGSAYEALMRSASLAPGERYAVVHTGGNWELKRWPPAHFAEWIRRFSEATERRVKVVLCGTTAEKPLVDGVLSALAGLPVVSLCGKTTLDTLALLLRGSEFLLSNDSGPIHLAASQGARIVGLYGPTSPELTGPLCDRPARILRQDVGCEVPCYFRSCDRRLCMETLTPERVLRATLEFASR